MSVPTDGLGLLMFAALLWPGFVYSGVWARRRPERQPTALREVVSIVAASLTALTVVAMLFAVCRALWPDITPDVGQLVFHGPDYVRTHYVTVAWWGLGLLATAIAGSAGAAAVLSSDRLSRVPVVGRFVVRPDPSTMSSWWMAFSGWDPDRVQIHIGCVLDDGSYVSGRLYSYSQLGNDSPDRDLLLRPPIRVRPAGAVVAQEVTGAGLLVVSARRMVTMTVSYVDLTSSQAAPLSAPGPLASTRQVPTAPSPPAPSAP